MTSRFGVPTSFRGAMTLMIGVLVALLLIRLLSRFIPQVGAAAGVQPL